MSLPSRERPGAEPHLALSRKRCDNRRRSVGRGSRTLDDLAAECRRTARLSQLLAERAHQSQAELRWFGVADLWEQLAECTERAMALAAQLSRPAAEPHMTHSVTSDSTAMRTTLPS